MSRDSILNNIKASQPQVVAMPEIPVFKPWFDNAVMHFAEVSKTIGSEVHFVNDYEQIISIIQANHADARRIITTIEQLAEVADHSVVTIEHDYENVDLYIIAAKLAVAENGAVWITENELLERVLPFIAQHLMVIIPRNSIVDTMHDAYASIGDAEYGFATFIAGPSKTADIEQSLVLGAHGPKSMTVFIM